MYRQFGHRPYPGDSSTKREARHLLYQIVAARLPKGSGHVVTLAGPDAPEVPYFRDLLRLSPHWTWFVDVHKQGLLEAKRAWPGVRTFHGPIEKAFLSSQVPSVRFAHLDFMGIYTSTVAKSVRALGTKLVDGGIVAFTFMRGREDHSNRRARCLAALEGLSGKTLEAREIQRWIGTFLALQEDLGRPLVLLDGVAYRHNQSAMAAIIVQAQ